MLLQRAQAFLPVGTLLLRVVLMYIGGSYWVFAARLAPTSLPLSGALLRRQPDRQTRNISCNSN
ncbi:hypothetical protein [Mesorhizobium sp. M0228]|uniref:hypothetical protein n=1 Tax=unclassified Mesorhizobium TaxID=325217 RepID=UPI003336FE56